MELITISDCKALHFYFNRSLSRDFESCRTDEISAISQSKVQKIVTQDSKNDTLFCFKSQKVQ